MRERLFAVAKLRGLEREPQEGQSCVYIPGNSQSFYLEFLERDLTQS